MRHLFIINPMSDRIRGKVDALINSIYVFFKENPHMHYDVHVSRWERDSMVEIREYAKKTRGLLRVHAMGGSSTLFEAVNGVFGLPNTQVAAYPFGSQNVFLQYFGADKIHLFSSVRSQVLSGTIPVDLLKCGHFYGIAYVSVGLELPAFKRKTNFDNRKRIILLEDLSMLVNTAKVVYSKDERSQRYHIALDGITLDSPFAPFFIANGPCYGRNLIPAPEAHPNDGVLDLYVSNDPSLSNFFPTVIKYMQQKSLGAKERRYYSGHSVSIVSDRDMNISVDGQAFVDKAIKIKIMPYAIDFVCPSGIDIEKIPRVRQKK